MDASRKLQIRMFIETAQPRPFAQAVRDAVACRESRRKLYGCGCFCCDLYDHLQRNGWNMIQAAADSKKGARA